MTILANKTTLLFDLDGTLIDSAPDLAYAANLMLKQLGYPTHSEAQFRLWIGNGAKVLVARALSGARDINPQLSDELIESSLALFLTLYLDNCHQHTYLYEGVESTLVQLKQLGFKLALVTNKPQQFIKPILHALHIEHYFDVLIGGDLLAKRKPDPMQLHHCCNVLKVTVTECVMVGDSKNDILAAKAAGMDSIGVTYGYNYGEDIGVYQPQVKLDAFAEITNQLDISALTA